MQRERTDRAWFSRPLRHPVRKRSGSILSTLEPTRGHTSIETLISSSGVYILKVLNTFICHVGQKKMQYKTEKDTTDTYMYKEIKEI